MGIVNIYDNYNSYFNPDCNSAFKMDYRAIFEFCSKIAHENGFRIFLIGGIVRDLLLNIKNFDIDITVEGSAIEFAKCLEKVQKGEKGSVAKILSIHKPFGTAKVEIMGKKIDFASTRSESYPKKGHLPHVEKIGCDLIEDVVRRDFTINAMALSLNKEDFADLIDYTGGYADLRAKKLRILHDKSFIDDPTRIVRGLKFASRLGFELDKKTMKLQEKYLENVNYDMSCKRLRNELKETFDLNSNVAFEKFFDQKIYKLVSTCELEKVDADIASLVKKYKIKHPWIVYLGIALLQEQKNACEVKLLDDLQLNKYEKAVILDAKKLFDKKMKDDFEIYKTFSGVNLETVLILAVLNKSADAIKFLDELKNVKISIKGQDILELGIKPSKAYKDALDYLLREKLKNPNIDLEQEKRIVTKFFAQTQL